MRLKNLWIVLACSLCVAVNPLINARGAAAVEQRQDTDGLKIRACEQEPYSIMVTVREVRHSEGTITVDLHGDDPDKFLEKGQRVDRVRAPAQEGETLICIPVAEPGVYAFALYHDEDGDTKFDKNFIGLPAEPFGLSNDPRIRLAKPKHEECAFEVTGPLTPVVATLHH